MYKGTRYAMHSNTRQLLSSSVPQLQLRPCQQKIDVNVKGLYLIRASMLKSRPSMTVKYSVFKSVFGHTTTSLFIFCNNMFHSSDLVSETLGD